MSRIGMRHLTDLTGKIIGRWEVLGVLPNKGKHRMWKCRCSSCGVEYAVYHTHLLTGKTKRCFSCSRGTHGHHRGGRASATLKSWENMKDRCSNPKCTTYPIYGARGITYDPRWDNFEAFLEDMGERPEGCTLDRIDGNCGYTKDNCRWADVETQQNNRSNNVKITHNGETLTLAQWSRKLNIPRKCLYSRYRKGKRGEELLKPSQKQGGVCGI